MIKIISLISRTLLKTVLICLPLVSAKSAFAEAVESSQIGKASMKKTTKGGKVEEVVLIRSSLDQRIAFVQYTEDRVIDVPVQIGVMTAVEVKDGESIVYSSSGWGAECKNDDSVWCISVFAGMPVMYVQPRDCKAPYWRMNVHMLTKDSTGKTRKYRLEFRCVAKIGATVHAIQFRYSDNKPISRPSAGMVMALEGDAEIGQNGSSEPVLRKGATDSVSVSFARENDQPKLGATIANQNRDYSQVVGPDSDELIPALVTDNGMDTTITLRPGAPVPAVFRLVGDAENEVLMRVVGRKITVEGVSDNHLLRLDGKVVRIIRTRKIADLDRQLNRYEKTNSNSANSNK